MHSPVDGHLGYFHVLVVVNSTAISITLHISFGIMVFSIYMPRNGVTYHKVSLLLVF